MANKTHIDNWITKAEPDYYTMFIKAWIPFNAWYFTEYSTKTDSEALEKIKKDPNKIRNRIEALLVNVDNESRNFRYHLAQLHIELEKRSVKNYEKSVSFTCIALKEFFPSPVTDNDSKGNVYKAIPHKSSGYRAVIVGKNNNSLMDATFSPYSLNDFLLHYQYIKIQDPKMKEKIKICFEKIDPEKPVNLVSKSKIKSEFILLDSDSKIQFINDTQLIAKAIIQTLYTLRCVLFHGQLDPTDINQAIYEHAFTIIKPIIKELK